MLNILMADLQWARRSLVRTKGIVAAVALTLGLGLAFAALTYSLLDSTLHPYSPFRDPDALLNVTFSGDPQGASVTAYERYVLLRDSRIAEQAEPVITQSAVVSTPTLSVQVPISEVSPSYFAFLGVQPVLGRTFVTGSQDATAAVLGMENWRRLFPGREGLQGATILVGGSWYDIVGVMPQQVGGVFLRLPDQPDLVPRDASLHVSLRLALGSSRETVARQLGSMAQRLTAQYGRPFRFGMSSPRRAGVVDAVQFILVGAGFAILAIVCVNMMNLMLARGLARRREVAIRLALGASRVAVVRLLVIEALIIASIGAAVGIPLAVWGLSVARNAVPASGTVHNQVYLSWRTYLFVLAATATVGVLAGVLPGLRVTQVSLAATLKSDAVNTGGRQQRGHRTLAIAQLAMATTLLTVAGLFARAADRVSRYDFGFDPRPLVGARGFIDWGPRDHTDGREAFAHILSLARRIEGVQAAALIGSGGLPVEVTSEATALNSRVAQAQIQRVSAGFDVVLGLRIVDGRAIEPGDLGTGVAVVDQSAARAFFPGKDPLGRLIRPSDGRSQWLRVVGVARDIELDFRQDANSGHVPTIYVAADTVRPRWIRIVVRASSDQATVALRLARELQAGLSLRFFPTAGPWMVMSGFAGRQQAQRYTAMFFLMLGSAALTLAAIGLYGTLAYGVGRREREFGIRAALGASRADLFRVVVRDGFVMTLAGAVVGYALAIVAGKVLEHSLYGVQATDLFALAGAQVVLYGVAMAASVIPARRATLVDPVEVLRAI
jgi:putative ABC transport system permease protein